MASLGNNEGNFGRLRLMSQLKLAEIQSNLESYIFDSLKTLNNALPQLYENGSKEMLLETNLLMGKILLKVSALKLDKPSKKAYM